MEKSPSSNRALTRNKWERGMSQDGKRARTYSGYKEQRRSPGKETSREIQDDEIQ